MVRTGATVLVTGATSGVGRALTLALARAGVTVGAVARSAEALEALAAATAGEPGTVLPLPADVADPDAVAEAVAVLTSAGPLDAAVHAAGVVDIGRFEDVPPELFDGVLRTTLGGTVVVTRAVLPHLRRSGGPLVVLGSMLGEVPSPLMSAYVTAKHGVHGLVRSLQAELGRSGPPVVLVQPSAVRTPIYTKAGTQAGGRGAPVPPVVDPEQVAARVLAALDRPRRTVRVGPLVGPAVALYRLLPGAYEALAAPGRHPAADSTTRNRWRRRPAPSTGRDPRTTSSTAHRCAAGCATWCGPAPGPAPVCPPRRGVRGRHDADPGRAPGRPRPAVRAPPGRPARKARPR